MAIVVGNLAILVSILTTKTGKQSRMKYFIMHLAIAGAYRAVILAATLDKLFTSMCFCLTASSIVTCNLVVVQGWRCRTTRKVIAESRGGKLWHPTATVMVWLLCFNVA